MRLGRALNKVYEVLRIQNIKKIAGSQLQSCGGSNTRDVRFVSGLHVEGEATSIVGEDAYLSHST